MNTTWEQLTTLVGRHIGLYEELAGLMSREQAALLEMDLDRIQEAAKAKETQLLKIKMMVPVLSKAIQGMAHQAGLPEDPQPTLSELSSAAPSPWAKQLARSALALARLKRGIRRHNEANRSFVQESLDLISGSIAILTGSVSTKKTGYLANGQHAPAAGYQPVKLSCEV